MVNHIGKLIPGKIIANRKELWLKTELTRIASAPKLRIIQVGDDPASSLYVNMKVNAARKLGIDMEARIYKTGIDSATVIAGIEALNQDETVHGVMVQAPIQGVSLSESLKIFNSISPAKDVDGLSYASLGKLWQLKHITDLKNADLFISATPLGALDCLLWLANDIEGKKVENENITDMSYGRFANLDRLLNGKKVLIINRSNIVGKPLAALLTLANATVTLAHSHTINIDQLMADTDIIITATGKDHIYEWGKIGEKKIILDIGINNNNPDAVVRGDIAFEPGQVSQGNTGAYLAGVPGGVGPLTVINLLYNTYLSYSRANGLIR